MVRPRLTCCVRDYPYTAAIKSGTIGVRGAALDFVEVVPHIAAFRRMVRDLEFDICELAPTTYMIARAHGVPLIALPIFFLRRFHHAGLLVRADAGIDTPKDLEGKRVGVRAWSVTTGVWKRGILQNEYGVDLEKISWFVDDEEHVTSLALPPHVHQVPEGQSLVGMFAAGLLDAGTAGDAGLGRQGKPGAGWEQGTGVLPPDMRELFPDPGPRDADYFRRTGVLPMHGTLVVKEALLQENPGLAPALFEAFTQARAPYADAIANGTAAGKDAARDVALARIVGDPLPYGLEANRASIQALIDYATQQGLIPAGVTPEGMFLGF